jgi:predicted small lipoprotein YifL
MSPTTARVLLPAIAGAALLLTACGQKGPLVLPDAGVTTPVIIRGPAETTPAETTPPATAPAPQAEPEPAKPKPGRP